MTEVRVSCCDTPNDHAEVSGSANLKFPYPAHVSLSCAEGHDTASVILDEDGARKIAEALAQNFNFDVVDSWDPIHLGA